LFFGSFFFLGAGVVACSCLRVWLRVTKSNLVCRLAKGDTANKEQATALLVDLSRGSNVIRVAMVEMLNSLDHRERLAAIQLVRFLNGASGKDCADKLLAMMWEDWHLDNRLAAAESLALSGNGRVMHDDLIARLNDPVASEMVLINFRSISHDFCLRALPDRAIAH
jgi:hypothetical protein